MNEKGKERRLLDGLVEARRDQLGELVQLAAGKQELPAAIVERAREVVETHRVAEALRHSKRRRRRNLGFAAAAAVIVLAVFAGLQLMGPPNHQPTLIHSVRGAVAVVDSAGVASNASSGSALRVGTRIETAADSRVALLLPSGHSVRLDTDSQLLLVSPAVVALERGAVYVDSGPGSAVADSPLTVRTNFGTVHDVGTQFLVRDEGASLHIGVREGLVRLNGAEGTHQIDKGAALTLDAQGQVIRTEILAYGPEWDWVGQITPTMDIAGRPLLEFLDWVSTESGLRLVFADPSTAEAAEQIILKGSVTGMSPDEALQAVLPTCQMTRTVESGILVIHSESGSGR